MKKSYLLTVAAVLTLTSPIALAQNASVTTTTTTVAPTVEGGVVYESHSVTSAPGVVVQRPVTFYYYDTAPGQIVAATTMSKDIFNIWDKDRNGYISPQEYYENAMVIYEPIETKTTVFSDIDADGRLELTQEEYTLRLQQLPGYAQLNTDAKTGISVHEFVGAGFQETDDNDDNQVSYDELVEQFYNQPRLASEQERYN